MLSWWALALAGKDQQHEESTDPLPQWLSRVCLCVFSGDPLLVG